MSDKNAAFAMHGACRSQADPGNGNIIKPQLCPCIVPLVSTTAETRTLTTPVEEGDIVFLYMLTDGGDIVVTVTGGYNEDGDTTFTFSDAGQFAGFVSFRTASSLVWRKFSDYGLGNIAPADSTVLAALSGLTATAAEVNAAADQSARTIALAPAGSTTTTLDAATYSDHIIHLTSSTVSFNLALPAFSGSGAKWKILFGASLSSATVTLAATGKHLFGGVTMNTDTAAANLFTCVAAANAAGATSMTFDGTTKGGRKGDWITIEDVATSLGLVHGHLNGSGTEDTPFA